VSTEPTFQTKFILILEDFLKKKGPPYKEILRTSKHKLPGCW